jgi:hypothetical protein
MRTTVRHTPPEVTQPEPLDNTSDRVMAQVALWRHGPGHADPSHGQLIHVQAAMEIAAWYQTPRNCFAAFASTGTLMEGLAGDIIGEIQRTRDQPENFDNPLNDRWCLRALLAYVRAVPVTVWTVGENDAGYLPEGESTAFMRFDDAVTAYVDMVREAPDALTTARDAGDCSADALCGDPELLSDESCEYHDLSAVVGAYLTDDAPYVNRPAPASLSLRPDSRVTPREYWLTETMMTYGEYLDQY